MDTGFHFCKFSKWLPGAPACAVDMAPSGNMLLARDDFERAGRFPGELFVGDVALSRRLRELDVPLWFEPSAIGTHHHLSSVRDFLHERFTRGRLYGELRRTWYGPLRRTLLTIATILPVRLARNVMLVGAQASRAGRLGAFVRALPLVVAGYAATLAGEARGLARSAPAARK
jgi:GT2 family glycosyltransferase